MFWIVQCVKSIFLLDVVAKESDLNKSEKLYTIIVSFFLTGLRVTTACS